MNSRRNKPRKTVCQFCGESFNDGRKLGGHIVRCKLNPKYDDIHQKLKIANQNKNFHWSEEDKKRMSEKRIKYLTEHPDKVPYKLNHSSKMSYPEKKYLKMLWNLPESLDGHIIIDMEFMHMILGFQT